jgi:hypothetical protein
MWFSILCKNDVWALVHKYVASSRTTIRKRS